MVEIDSLRAYRSLEAVDWKAVDGHIVEVFGEGVMNTQDKYIGRRELVLLDEYEVAGAQQLTGMPEGVDADDLASVVESDMPESFAAPMGSKSYRAPKITPLSLPSGQRKRMLTLPIKPAAPFKTERGQAVRLIRQTVGQGFYVPDRGVGIWLAGVTTNSFIDTDKLFELERRLKADIGELDIGGGSVETVTIELR